MPRTKQCFPGDLTLLHTFDFFSVEQADIIECGRHSIQLSTGTYNIFAIDRLSVYSIDLDRSISKYFTYWPPSNT